MPTNDFSPPYNWCDSRCERCPLDDCAVRLSLGRRARTHEVRGEDPEAPEVWLQDLHDNLQRSIDMLEALAQEEGLDLDTPPVPPKLVSLDVRRLSKAGQSCFTAALDAFENSSPLGSEGEEILDLATLVKVKTARLTAFGEGEREETWEIDAVPNLFLIEQTLRAMGKHVSSLRATMPGTNWGRLEDSRLSAQRLIAEHLAGRFDARRVLADLVKQGKAPSPFCTAC